MNMGARHRGFLVIACVWAALTHSASTQPQIWPRLWWVYGGGATWMLDIQKTSGEAEGDPWWAQLTTPGKAVGLGIHVTDINATLKPLDTITDLQIRYTVHGVPVSPWLPTPFTFTLSADNPALASLPDGVHDISLEAQGTGKPDYSYRPIYLHLARPPYPSPSPLVPILSRDVMYQDYGVDTGPGVRYINYADMRRAGHPVDPGVTPWHGPSATEPNLYQEEMAPRTDLFIGQQMWWEHPSPPHAGTKYTRAINPKWDEDHRGLRKDWHHDRFPFIDGPRGVGWASAYISGQIDSHGTFYFVEAGGPLRKMTADGTITTLAGWRVAPGKDPIWVGQPLEVVRRNEVFEGVFLSGRYADGDGFRTPLDVTIDPKNEGVLFIAGYEDHAIWRADCRATPCQVSVFAGDVAHTPGFVNGSGTTARFHGPSSLTFDPVCDCLYVADQDNDAIRRVSRSAEVTTLFGSPGQAARQMARGVTINNDQYLLQGLNRTAAGEHYARGAGNSTPLETFYPQTVRVDSRGNLILLDVGFGAIRRIDPTSLAAEHLVWVNQRFERNDATSSRGWAWLDVDRWGNSGPLDSIYYGAFQASWCDGEKETRANEAYCWMAPTEKRAHFLFRDWSPFPDGWGPREQTDPPHYFWLAAVDPRGAVLFAGGGEHGMTRLRKRKAGDPVIGDDNANVQYEQLKNRWRYGWGGTEPTPMLRNGSEAHSYLGLPDAWDYKDATDAAIVAAFGIPNNPDRAGMIQFIRWNGGGGRRPRTPDRP